jgi:hypothetical protein
VKALGGEWHEECFCCTVPPPPSPDYEKGGILIRVGMRKYV